jgi:hypothetical protein
MDGKFSYLAEIENVAQALIDLLERIQRYKENNTTQHLSI